MRTIIISILISLFMNALQAQVWNSLNDLSLGENGIYKLKVYDDTLYISGVIWDVNGASSSGIFKWDSTETHVISDVYGIDAQDFDYNNDTLHVVGGFNTANDIPGTRGIAGFSQNTWWSVGGGGGAPTDSPSSMCRFNNKVYIGHGFSEMGGISIPYSFASWDGNTWVEEEGVFGLDHGPRVMTIYNNELIGGGTFNQTTTGQQMYRVGRFDGTHWYDMNGGVNGSVYSLLVDGEDLYVGGTCTLAQFGDVVIPNNIARFDGENWHAVGNYEEIGNTISAIAMYRGQIYVGGLITLNGSPMEFLAYFDGVHWHEVPGNEDMDNVVKCLQVYKDELYIGGSFQHAGGLEVPGIVRYYLHPDSVQWGVPDLVVENNFRALQVFPNPAGNNFQIQLDGGNHGDVLITDLAGRQLLREAIQGRSALEIDASSFPRGMVVVSLLEAGQIKAAKKVFLE